MLAGELSAKRQWLLGKKATEAKMLREAQDQAHTHRESLRLIEEELRQLEKDEIKALKGSGGTDG